MNADPKFCSQCGVALNPGARFCPQCGQPVTAATPSPPQRPSPPSNEPILGIVPLAQRRKGFLGLGVETFNIIITPHRLVFAIVTKEQMNQAVATARDQARSEGKGFFGQAAAQMGWVNVICQSYATTPIPTILNRPDSFAIANSAIQKIRLRNRQVDEDSTITTELIIKTTGGKHKFTLQTMNRRQAREILQQTLGPVVK